MKLCARNRAPQTNVALEEPQVGLSMFGKGASTCRSTAKPFRIHGMYIELADLNHTALTRANVPLRCSAAATRRAVLMAVSGLSEIESMPCVTSHSANSGKSEGACPQIPMGFFASCAERIAWAIILRTAALFSSNR